MRLRLLIVLALSACVLVGSPEAQVYRPRVTPAVGVDCSDEAVQAAIDAASDGGTVTIGAGSCTWDAAVSIPSGKNITLQGAGAGVTTITASVGLTDSAILGVDSASRVTGFTFVCGVLQFYKSDFRFDHNTFTCPTYTHGVLATSQTQNYRITGLVDHNTFVNRNAQSDGSAEVSLAEMNGSTDWSHDSGDPQLGTADALYIEDNTFTGTATSVANASDCNYSGRYVFRFNTVTDMKSEVHGVQAIIRACRKWEIYENDYTSTGGGVAPNASMLMRGGTGVIFSNTMTGTFSPHSAWFIMDVQRSFQNVGAPFGFCDGASAWDANTLGSGYRCRDQIGTGGDVATFSSAKYVAQIDYPARFWLNTWGGSLGEGRVSNGLTGTIAASPSATTTSASITTDSFGCSLLSTYGPGQPISLVISGVTTYTTVSTASYGTTTCDVTFPAQSAAPTTGSTALSMSTLQIQANRNYYNDIDASCSGGSCTTGIGVGVRASRPAAGSSVDGVAWWATDHGGNWNTTGGSANDGCLDVMVSGSWVDCFYTPYTYPHPKSTP